VHRDQLFFIAFGRIWAENIKPEALVQRVRTDPHSPNQYRVDGTLHNIPEFAKAFNCSPKAKVRLSIDPTECPSHQLFSLTLPRRNDAFSGRNPRRIRIRVLIIYYLSPRATILTYAECVRRRLYCESSVLTATPFLAYNTPLVLGTSFPPVRSMAWRMARARALKADSAL
jgi:Peptidase family M13